MVELKLEDEKYPKRLRKIKDAPKNIYCEGNIDILNNLSIAIIGARKHDEYGVEQTKIFTSYLAQKGFTIISGLAKGIDTYAHEYSKRIEGKTVAVLPCGFNKIFPIENRQLFYEIVENGGCIVSEYDPDTEVDMGHFRRRNRIISGLSVATLVVEARHRSGSVITAHHAFNQLKPVFCIPGDINSTRSRGCNELIQEGANLVIMPQDIIDILDFENIRIENKKIKKLELDEDEIKVYNLIGTIPIIIDDLSRKSCIKIKKLSEILFNLELKNLIKKIPGSAYVIKE